MQQVKSSLFSTAVSIRHEAVSQLSKFWIQSTKVTILKSANQDAVCWSIFWLIWHAFHTVFGIRQRFETFLCGSVIAD